ncbi:hypothetical protein [Rosettibacter firmus]|uniref:hypothetical protein n=1 Tax=Rosettibacter firmus TaxID=3111522 RepID=UPI00336C0B11
MKNKFPSVIINLLFLFLFLSITETSFSQENNSKWLIINNKTFIDTSNILISNDELYVWVLELNSPPLIIENIDREIFKTKTYYLINKNLKRYSILQIIYYDKKENVIKSFSYNYDWDDITLKYSTPILEGSTMDTVLNKCMEFSLNK